jgi:hypothetical protein
MRVRAGSAVLVAILALLLAGNTAWAQEVTLPVTPDPSQCDAEPITVDEVMAIVSRATPEATEAAAEDDAEPTEFALPDGEPVDEETAQEITATVVDLIACLNAGDYFAFLSFFADHFLVEQLGTDITPEDLADAPGPTAEAREAWGTLLDVREATELPDGRVGALIDASSRTKPGCRPTTGSSSATASGGSSTTRSSTSWSNTRRR